MLVGHHRKVIQSRDIPFKSITDTHIEVSLCLSNLLLRLYTLLPRTTLYLNFDEISWHFLKKEFNENNVMRFVIILYLNEDELLIYQYIWHIVTIVFISLRNNFVVIL